MKLKRPAELSPQTMLTVLFLLSLFSFLIVELFPALFYRKIDTASYLVFHNIAEFFSIIVSFSIVGVGLYTFDQSRDRHALFLSSAFLGIGLLDFMHTLSYAGMPAFITPNSANKSTQLWIAARMFTAIVFLISAFIESDSKSRWLTKLNLLAVIFTTSGLVFIGIIFYPSYMPVTFIENVGLTPFKIYSEYLIISLFILTSAVYWKRFLRTGNRLLIFYIAAFVFCIFSELAFAGYMSVFDTYNVLGHIYKVAAFVLIYRGIFITSVKRPYSMLQQDITERKRAEEALRGSEEHYHALFNLISDAVYIIDQETGRVLDVNEAACRIYGYTRDEWLKMKNTDVSAEPDETRKATKEPPNIISVRYHRKKDGTVFPLEMTLNTFNLQGRKAIIVTARDVTERKRAEEEIRETKTRLQLQFDRMPIGCIVWDTDFKVVSWNPAAENIFGFTLNEALGKHPYDIIVPKEAQPQVNIIWQRLLEGDETAHSINENNTKDVRTILCEWHNTPLRDAENRIIGALSMVQDITERKRAEEELRKYQEHLEELVKDRTAELETKNAELERMNRVFVGRELRMIELKKMITELEKEIGDMIKSGSVK